MRRVTVVLDDESLARLDGEARALGISRSKALRRRLEDVDVDPLHEPEASSPTRASTLAKLERAAAAGSVTAMVALERALRLAPLVEPGPTLKPGPITVRDLTAAELRLVR